MQLTKNFTLDEMTASQTADRHGIDNTCTEEDLKNLEFLCQMLLQKIRDRWGPVVISSGFRGEDLNRMVGGSSLSQHCYGQAADLKFVQTDILTVANWLVKESGLIWDQLIVENYHPGQPGRGWLHVSLVNGPNRGEVMTAKFVRGKAQYHKGLPS